MLLRVFFVAVRLLFAVLRPQTQGSEIRHQLSNTTIPRPLPPTDQTSNGTSTTVATPAAASGALVLRSPALVPAIAKLLPGNGATTETAETAMGPSVVSAAAAPYANFSVHAYGYGKSKSATITAHFA